MLTVFPNEPQRSVNVLNRCRVEGDFDAKVHFELVEWPPENEIRVGLIAFDLARQEGAAVQRVSDPGFGGESYLTHFVDGVQGITPTQDLSGGLRLARVDGELTGYYLDGGQWVPIHSVATDENPVQFRLAAWTEDATPGGVVAFDGFAVEADGIMCNFLQMREIRDLILKLDAMLELETLEPWIKESMLYELGQLMAMAEDHGFSPEELHHIARIMEYVQWLVEIESATDWGDGGTSGGVSVPDGLVAWWPGDGHANDIVGGHHGILRNDITFAPGMVGEAFSFDGDEDYFVVGDDPDLNPGLGDFSVDFWLKTESSDIRRFIMQKGRFGVDDRWRIAITQDGIIGGGTTPVNDGQWHHVAVVREGTTNKVYVDGQLDGTNPQVGDLSGPGSLFR